MPQGSQTLGNLLYRRNVIRKPVLGRNGKLGAGVEIHTHQDVRSKGRLPVFELSPIETDLSHAGVRIHFVPAPSVVLIHQPSTRHASVTPVPVRQV